MINKVYIGLGSNVGDRAAQIQQCLDILENNDLIDVREISSFLDNPAVANTPQPDFLNAAAEIHTILSPQELLDFFEEVEAGLGRTHKGEYEPRTMDIDILFFNDEIICTERLTIPHPLIQERRFVLEPLSEIAPDYIHPLIQENVQTLLEHLS